MKFITQAVVFIALFISFESAAQYIIDGDNCDALGGSNEWGTPTVSDPDDSGSSGSDIKNFWFEYNEVTDTFCVAFERYKDSQGGPSASFGFLMNTNCDSIDVGDDPFELGADHILGFEWVDPDQQDLVIYDILEKFIQVIDTVYIGQSICGDNSTKSTFAEFCFSKFDLINAGVFDPCGCSDIEITGVVTYAGGSFQSAVKDTVVFDLNPEVTVVNEVPIANMAIPMIQCDELDLSYDASGSMDLLPFDDSLRFVLDFDYDGMTIDTQSILESGTHTYGVPGNYNVLLIVSDNFGCTDTIEQLILFSGFNTAIADVTINSCDRSVDYTGINSIDGSPPDNLIYEWDFGDGTTGTAVSGTIVYDDCSPRTIQLVISDPDAAAECQTDTTQVNIVFDNLPPVISCPTNLMSICTISDVAGAADLPSFILQGGIASDDCEIISIAFSDVSDNNVCPETISRTYEVTDTCGLMASCVQTIIIDDQVAPTFIPPGEISVGCNVDLNDRAITGDITMVMDNCNDLDTSFIDDNSAVLVCSGLGVLTRTWTVTDACGNFSTGTQIINVIDLSPAIVTFPPDLTLDCSLDLDDLAVTGDIGFVQPSCGAGLVGSYTDVPDVLTDCNGTGLFERQWIATDICGNITTHSQFILVTDTIDPFFDPPSDITVDCTIDLNDLLATGDVTNLSDNCGVLEVLFSDDLSGVVACNGEGLIIRTFTATDNCGNTYSDTQNITIEEETPSSFTIPGDVTLECDQDFTDLMLSGNIILIEGSCVANLVASYSDDNSALTDCSATGVITRTWTISNDCESIGSGIQTLTIVDTIPPSFTCNDVTLDLGGGIFSLDPMDVIVNVMDNCDTNPMLSLSKTMFDCDTECTPVQTVTLTATDACGNSSSCDFLVTINNEAPTISCPADISTECQLADVTPSGDITEFIMAGGTVSDDCAIAMLSVLSETSDNGACPETVVRVYEVSDACGLTASCVQTIIIDDQVAPTFIPPGEISVGCNVDLNDRAITGDITMVMDNCNDLDTSFIDDNSGVLVCNGLGVLTRTWTVTDACGNFSTGTQIINVIDLSPAIVTFPPDLTLDCSLDLDDLAVTGDIGFVQPSCGAGLVGSYTDVPDVLTDCNGTGLFERQWIATDICGNITTHSQFILVTDTIDPFFDPPSDITVDCTIDLNDLLATGDVTNLSDNCGVLEVLFSDDLSGVVACSGEGLIIRTFTATDNCGNTYSDTQNITIEEETPPSFAIPGDVTLECDQDFTDLLLTGDITINVSACNMDITANYFDDISMTTGCNGTGVITRTWTTTDGCGVQTNSDQLITIEDNIDPFFDPPTDITVDCTVDISDLMSTGEVTNLDDNCGILEISFVDDLSGITSCNGEGTLVRNFTATDNCGNTYSDSQNITIVQGTNPSFLVPDAVSISCDEDITDLNLTGDIVIMEGSCMANPVASYSDDVSGLTGCSGTGIVERTWTVIDDCGPVGSEIQIISLVDNEAPTFGCRDFTFDLEAGGYTLDPNDIIIGLDDNCDSDPTLNLSKTDFDCNFDCSPIQVITLTATDACGNSSSCEFNVVIYTAAPTITCPPSLTATCNISERPPYANLNQFIIAGGTADDDCAISNFTLFRQNSNRNSCPEIVTRTYQVTDPCGNRARCSQIITIDDEINPSFTTPSDISINCTLDPYDVMVTGNVTSFADNCGVPVVNYVDDISGLQACNGLGVITRTWTVTDRCGNSVNDDQLIYILDLNPPTVIFPMDITIDCSEDPYDLDETGDISIMTPGCSGGLISNFTNVPRILTGCNRTGVLERVWSVTDICGNVTSQSQFITVTDDIDPFFDPPADITIDCSVNINNLNLTGRVTNLSDNCGTAQVVYSDDFSAVAACNGEGQVIRTFTATDNCGNSFVDTQNILIAEAIPPSFTLPPDITILCDQDSSDLNITGFVELVDGSCTMGLVADYFDDLSGLTGCSGTGIIIRNWEIITDCGPLGNGMQVITIVDTIPPVASCIDLTIDFRDGSPTTLTPDDFNDGSFDNCDTNPSLTVDKSSFDCVLDCTPFDIITLTVTDECGNFSTCESIVTYLDDAPEIVCPEDITIQLDEFECSRVVDFDVTATDDCDPNPTISQTDNSGLSSGSEFSSGTTDLNYQVEDCRGATNTCAFSVILIPVPDTISTLICKGQVNVSLDQECCAVITADMVLLGTHTYIGCLDDVIINIYYTSNPVDIDILAPEGNKVTGYNAGDTVIYTVTNPIDSNICWGRLLVQDKLAPVLVCNDTIVNCYDDINPEILGFPNVGIDVVYEKIDSNHYRLDSLDRCGETFLSYSDQYQKEDCLLTPYLSSIIRTWYAEDRAGNKDTCQQIISVRKLIEDNINFPDDWTLDRTLSCDKGQYVSDTIVDSIGWNILDNGYPSPFNMYYQAPYDTIVKWYGTGFPIAYDCGNMKVSYEDYLIPTCGNGFKIIRTWTVLDWCTSQVYVEEQLIKVGDNEAPMIICPENVTIGCDPNTGLAWYDIPDIESSDNCSEVTLEYSTGFGSIIQNGIISVVGLPIGRHEIIITAIDVCGNRSDCSFYIDVVDLSPPVAVCDQHTTVSLGLDGKAKIQAKVFDDGSHDKSSEVYFKTRRMDNFQCELVGLEVADIEFSDFAYFCCEDVNSEEIMVVLRVYDVNPGAGPIDPKRHDVGGDLYEHYNDCMVLVSVQDKIPPFIVGLPDITLSCEFEYSAEHLDIFGSIVAEKDLRDTINIEDELLNFSELVYGIPLDGYVVDGCEVEVKELPSVIKVFDCGNGLIIRSFKATDLSGNFGFSQQRINFENQHQFYISDNSCENEDESDGVEWPCNVTIEDNCSGEINIDPEVTGKPIINNPYCSPIAVHYEDKVFYQLGDNCKTIIRTWTLLDHCRYEENIHGYGNDFGIWKYNQKITIENTIAPEFTSNCNDQVIALYGEDCTEEITLTAVATDDCTAEANLTYWYEIDLDLDGDIDLEGKGSSVTVDAIDGDRYKVNWFVRDACYNDTRCSYHIDIVDRKIPNLYCIGSLSTSLMDGVLEVDVWANDIDFGTTDNCTPIEDINLRLAKVNDNPNLSVPENNYVTISCSDIINSPNVPVQLWAEDERGNWSYCLSNIRITDNNDCGTNNTYGIVSGQIMTSRNERVDDVQLMLEDPKLDVVMEETFTNEQGSYLFNDLAIGETYTIIPHDNFYPLEGVTTLDLVLIQRHILGIQKLESPYDIIAADINASHKITASDLISLRKVILGIREDFPNNDSWRFVNDAVPFLDLAAPWKFESQATINMSSQFENIDFTGVKIGDVNGSISEEIGNRSVVELRVNKIEKDDVSNVLSFRLPNDEHLSGFQLSLDLYSIHELGAEISVFSNLPNFNAENYNLDSDGKLRFSYSNIETITMLENNELFSILLPNEITDQALNSIKLDKTYLASELYDEKLETSSIELQHESIKQGQPFEFELYQNEPNPFINQSTIKVWKGSENRTVGKLEFFGVDGRKVFTIKQTFDQGMNRILINKKDLGGNTVLFYHLEVGNTRLIKKMIVIN